MIGKLTLDNLDEYLEKIGITKKDMEKILNAKPEDLDLEYRKLYNSLPKKLPVKLWKKIKAQINAYYL